MQYSHALGVLGAALGAAKGYMHDVGSSTEDFDGGNLKVRNAATAALTGLALGRGVGSLVDSGVSWWAGRRLHDMLSQYPLMTKRHLKRLIRYAPKDLPIYLQTKGSFGNAAYVPDEVPAPFGGEWVDARTGKKVKGSPTKRGVYIGKNFRKAPVLAHELGHASSFERHDGRRWSALGSAAGIGSLGLLLAAGLMGRKWHSDGGDGWLYGTAGLTAAGFGLGMLSDALQTREERRASDTAAAYLNSLKLPKRQHSDGLDLLSTAYRTYSPLHLGPSYRPDASRAMP